MLLTIDAKRPGASMCLRAKLLALVFAVPVFAQNTPELVTEAEKKISAAPADAKVPLLLDLADRLAPIDPDRALATAQRAFELAQTPSERLAAQAEQAVLRRDRGDYADAMQLARAGLAEAERLGDDHLRARFQYAIARAEWSLADYASSAASFHQVIQLAEKTGDLALLCDAHTGIAPIYQDINQHEQATIHLDQARKLAEQLGDARRLGDYYKVVGNQRAIAGDRAGARAAHERSRQIHEQAGNERGVADALQNLAALATTPDELTVAAANCAQAIAIYDRLGLPRHRLNAEREFGRVLVRMKRPAEAIAHLQTSMDLARSLGGRNAVANTARELALAYEAVGDLRAALDAQREFKRETDAIFNEKSRQQITVLNARYEADRREHEIDMLRRDQAVKEAELVRGRWQRYGLAAFLLGGALAVGAIVSRQRLKLRAEHRVLIETQAAKEAAEEADRVKTRFLGMATHDIRGPLGNIVNLSSELRQKSAALEPEHVDLIASEAQRVLCLVEELLTIAALETGKLELHRAPLDLSEVVHAAVGSLRWQATAKRQTIDFQNAPPGSTQFVGDAARLHQVATNLVSNAIKFSPPGATITISFDAGPPAIALRVRDEGPGLSADDSERLFTPFQRLSSHPTAGESSHGLGLSIAHEIVRLHHGTIRVESRPGEGATFIAEFPLDPSAAAKVIDPFERS